MKIRTKLVSNSSSSSFICIGEKPTNVNFVKLEGKTKENVLAYAGVKCNKDKKVYLTQFISDASDLYWSDQINSSIGYCEGNHGGPYQEEDFVEVLSDDWSSVWIRKEDYVEDKK